MSHKKNVLTYYPKAHVEEYEFECFSGFAIFPHKYAVNYIGCGTSEEHAWQTASQVCGLESQLNSLNTDKEKTWLKQAALQLM